MTEADEAGPTGQFVTHVRHLPPSGWRHESCTSEDGGVFMTFGKATLLTIGFAGALRDRHCHRTIDRQSSRIIDA